MHKNIALPTFITALILLIIAAILEATLPGKDGYDTGIFFGAVLILGPILIISAVSGIIHKLQSPTPSPIVTKSPGRNSIRWAIILVACICGWFALTSLL